jgi:hypothetical protein
MTGTDNPSGIIDQQKWQAVGGEDRQAQFPACGHQPIRPHKLAAVRGRAFICDDDIGAMYLIGCRQPARWQIHRSGDTAPVLRHKGGVIL